MASFNLTFLLFLCLCCIIIYAQPSRKAFRYDYEYVESKKSFYKLHKAAKTWQQAMDTCAEEGASLLYPEDAAEAAVMGEIIRHTSPLIYGRVFVGGFARLSKELFSNVNGDPVANLYHNWGPNGLKEMPPQHCMVFQQQDLTLEIDSCANKHSFICKKTLTALDWDNDCNMPNTGYKYNEVSNRCYKFHPNPSNLNWNEAKAACEAEMSYLAVTNNGAEAEILSNITLNSSILHTKRDNNECVFLGFQKSQRGWRTIHGVALNKTYSEWHEGEPNNAGPNEYCGGMFYDGTLNDLGCHLGCFFICEHEVDKEKTSSQNTESSDYLDNFVTEYEFDVVEN